MSKVCKSFKHKPTGVLIHGVYTDQTAWFSYKEILSVFKLEDSTVALRYYHNDLSCKHKNRLHAVTPTVTTTTQRVFINTEGVRDFLAKFVVDYGVAKRFMLFIKEIENELIALYIDVAQKNLFDYHTDVAKAYNVSGIEYRVINRPVLTNTDKAYIIRWASINGVDYYDYHSICKALNLKAVKTSEPYHKYLDQVPDEGTMYLSKRAFKGARIFPTACNSTTVLTYEGVLGFLDNIDTVESRELKRWFPVATGNAVAPEPAEEPKPLTEEKVIEMPSTNVIEMPVTTPVEVPVEAPAKEKIAAGYTIQSDADLKTRRFRYIAQNEPVFLTNIANFEEINISTIHVWVRNEISRGNLVWCDSEGNPFTTATQEYREKKRGKAFIFLTDKARQELGYTPEKAPVEETPEQDKPKSLVCRLDILDAKLDALLAGQERFDLLLTKMDTLIDVLREQKPTTFPDTIVLDFKRAVANQ